jgi:hypothetical protein
VLLEVHGLKAEPERDPLVFHNSRFRRLAQDWGRVSQGKASGG